MTALCHHRARAVQQLTRRRTARHFWRLARFAQLLILCTNHRIAARRAQRRHIQGQYCEHKLMLRGYAYRSISDVCSQYVVPTGAGDHARVEG